MTTVGSADRSETSSVDEGDVVVYLRAHPEFFDAHPELLSELSLSHGSGEATSLLERQVKLLRNENSTHRRQLDALMANARQNEALNANIHALVIKLMNAAGPQSIFEQLESCLRSEFGAEFVATRIFASAASVEAHEVPQFDPASRDAFGGLVAGGSPRCGMLPDGLAMQLFQESQALSAAIMPLSGSGWSGVLIIASRDHQRYQQDMATDFLTYLCDIVALVVDPWVKRTAAP